MRLSNKAIFLFIFLTAIFLRFINYFEIPFTHDEFSALFRLDFASFSELIEKGVKIDGHPAGIHVFMYYWTKLFGTSEWIVKLPFTIFGILSVWFIYKIACLWYNETVGLLTSAFIASIQYTVMYSQIARPYISGFFFSLLMVYYWTLMIKQPEKNYIRYAIGFVIAAALCAYNHYFSLLFAIIVGFSGLFFIQKKYLLKYIMAGIAIFVLFIPHLKIFSYQLNVGGVGGWLGKPHNDFILDYIAYIFNYSLVSIITALGIAAFGAVKTNFRELNYKQFLLFISWFLLPFLIGFFYSKYENAVLQFSVLIFNFPFIYFVLFGHLKLQNEKINLLLVTVILAVNIYSMVFNRQHYDLFYRGHYKQIMLDYNEVKMNADSTIFIIDSHEKISKYYGEKLNIDTNYISLRSFANQAAFITFLEQNRNYKQLYFGCMSSNNPLTVPIILDYYPGIVWQRNYAGGTTWLFSKNKTLPEANPYECLNFEKENHELWSAVNEAKITDSISYSGNRSYVMDSTCEWGPTFSENLDKILQNKNNFIDISIKVKAPDCIDDILIVATLETDGKNIHWSGTEFSDFVQSDQNIENWFNVHHAIKLSDVNLRYNTIKVNVFIWNKGKRNFLIDDFKIERRAGNPVIYGLYENF